LLPHTWPACCDCTACVPACSVPTNGLWDMAWTLHRSTGELITPFMLQPLYHVCDGHFMIVQLRLSSCKRKDRWYACFTKCICEGILSCIQLSLPSSLTPLNPTSLVLFTYPATYSLSLDAGPCLTLASSSQRCRHALSSRSDAAAIPAVMPHTVGATWLPRQQAVMCEELLEAGM
jgi:hypothetical protein